MRHLEARLERTRNASARLTAVLRAAGRPTTPSDIVAEVDLLDRIDEAERSRDRERSSLEQAESRLSVLQKYTYEKTVKELESDIKKAHSDELAKQATFELEKGKEDKLEKLIANCTLLAPIEGMVIYPNVPAFVQPGRPQIEEGATVRERQIILEVVDLGRPMRINAKVPEAMVAKVRSKMKARVKIDAFADGTLTGSVLEISPLPDPGNMNSNIKVYTTRIQLDPGQAGLRPGMTASADIVLDDRDNAIGVPVGAVVRYDGKPHVALKRPDGRVEWCEVVLGTCGDQVCEVTEGLRDGDQVILDPALFLSDEQRDRIKATTPTRKKAAAARKTSPSS
jgi:RND family efflux transporter MFP subunit